jgi:hypothetical protein
VGCRRGTPPASAACRRHRKQAPALGGVEANENEPEKCCGPTTATATASTRVDFHPSWHAPHGRCRQQHVVSVGYGFLRKFWGGTGSDRRPRRPRCRLFHLVAGREGGHGCPSVADLPTGPRGRPTCRWPTRAAAHQPTHDSASRDPRSRAMDPRSSGAWDDREAGRIPIAASNTTTATLLPVREPSCARARAQVGSPQRPCATLLLVLAQAGPGALSLPGAARTGTGRKV